MSWNKVLKLTWDPIKYSAKTIKNLNNKLADNMTESGKSDTPAIISTKINTAINRGNWERWNLRLNKKPKIIINGIKNKVLISLVIKAISVVFSPYNLLANLLIFSEIDLVLTNNVFDKKYILNDKFINDLWANFDIIFKNIILFVSKTL